MRLAKFFLSSALLFWASAAWSETPDLSALAEQLAKVRTTHGVNPVRDAGPELTTVKQTLRTWVERQLPPVPGQSEPNGEIYSLDPDDLTDLTTRLNQALNIAGLTCGSSATAKSRCGGDPTEGENDRGYLGPIRIARFDDDRYLMVVTSTGVRCGFDQSAYLYEPGADHHWRLLISIEQDQYGEKEYKPENFLSINVSPSRTAWNEMAPPPLVTTIGYQPWCSSNWNTLNTRLWRATRATPRPPAILDRDDELYTGSDFIAAARLTEHDLLVQFDGHSIDGDVLVRTHVLRYAIGPDDRLTRIPPVALNPGDFVEEWLSSPWTEASHWLGPKANRRALARLHPLASDQSRFGAFDSSPGQCRKDTRLWQVGFVSDPNGRGPNSRPNYFLVKWSAPYDFALIAVSRHPFPGCAKTSMPSSDIGSLFPAQGWTP